MINSKDKKIRRERKFPVVKNCYFTETGTKQPEPSRIIRKFLF